MGAQEHQSAPDILDRRTLARDHRVLAAILTPGLRVLDVGCGTGAITRGIAEAVGPQGLVIGIDRDAGLVARAPAQHAAGAHLRFEVGDAASLDHDGRFDVVTAARTLQWIADVPGALRRMVRALAPGGRLVVLDFNHAQNGWEPVPPPAFAEFYARFLAWREANGWDNAIADRLPAMLAGLGIHDVEGVAQDEVAMRGDDDFEERTRLWIEVIDSLGPTLVRAKACDAALIGDARQAYEDWRRSTLRRQTLAMGAVIARPAS